jgi:FkbM family methyltransferase
VIALLDQITVPVAGVVHVGAHSGQEIEEYLRRGLSKMILFEPLPWVFAALCDHVARAGAAAVTVNKALGASQQKVLMHSDGSDGTASSILKPAPLMDVQYPRLRFPASPDIEVEQTTLDNWFAASGLSALDYNLLVLDVQGYELEVFKGAARTLETTNALIVEIHQKELYLGSALVEDVDKLLAEYGFVRTATTWDGGTWGDGLYQRKPA